MAVRRTELPNGPFDIPEDSQETMPAPEWENVLSIFDGSLNPAPVSDLHKEVLKEFMAKKGGHTLWDLNKRSENSSVVTTSGECFDEQEILAVHTPVADVTNT